MRLERCAALAFAVVAASPVAAQEPPPQPGERVRLWTPATAEISGRFVSIENNVLVLEGPPGAAGPVRIPLASGSSLQVARGKNSSWLKAAGAGVAVGAGGALLGGVARVDCPADDPDCGDAGSVVAWSVGAAAVTTVVCGLLWRSDRWVDVTPAKTRITIAPLAGRGVGVALSVRF